MTILKNKKSRNIKTTLTTWLEMTKLHNFKLTWNQLFITVPNHEELTPFEIMVTFSAVSTVESRHSTSPGSAWNLKEGRCFFVCANSGLIER